MDESWSLSQFIIGMLFTAGGFVLVWKSDFFLVNFGRIPFAEKYLSTDGGTRLFYKFIGIIVMIGGMMYATGLFGPAVSWLFKKMFGRYGY